MAASTVPAPAAPEEQSVSSFPNPPGQFYKLYTDENVRAGRVPKPPPPAKGSYHMYGAPFDVRTIIAILSMVQCTSTASVCM